MSWLHYVAWAVLLIVMYKAVRFGWTHATLVNKVLEEAGHTAHRKRHIRPLTSQEKRAVLSSPSPRQRGRRRVVDPELLSRRDLDSLEEMFKE
jgi:hypothetical protein